MVHIYLKKFGVVMFDMDGTMIDNTAYHLKAWLIFCARHNIVLTESDYKQKLSGRKNVEIIKILFGKDCPDEKIRTYAAEKESIYREIYAPYIVEIKGLSDTIAKIRQANLPLALTTTAPIENRNFGLRELKLSNCFNLILGEEDIVNGKPDPEIYLKAARLLRVNPDKCLVFEDSLPGVVAAKNAGMTVIAILSSFSKKELKAADYWINDFSEITFD